MPNTPPRKCFQIHLSTAIVLMFDAGILIGANTFITVHVGERYISNGQHYTYYEHNRGFPMTLYSSYSMDGPIHFSKTGIIINSLFVLIVLGLTWFLCEWWFRRRAPRKDV